MSYPPVRRLERLSSFFGREINVKKKTYRKIRTPRKWSHINLKGLKCEKKAQKKWWGCYIFYFFYEIWRVGFLWCLIQSICSSRCYLSQQRRRIYIHHRYWHPEVCYIYILFLFLIFSSWLAPFLFRPPLCHMGFTSTGDRLLDRKKITYLAPCSGDLPSRFLLVGTLAWSES